MRDFLTLVNVDVDIFSRSNKNGPMKRGVGDRFTSVLDGWGAKARLARAIGYRREHIGKILNGDEPVPEHLEALLEFLEVVPPEQWPERWKSHD